MDEKQREKCVQPNALDFTVDQISKIIQTPCSIGEDAKLMRQQSVCIPTIVDTRESVAHWELDVGSYDFMSNFYVDLPEGVAAIVATRSTFIRNGLFVTTGLWDSGFKGPAGGVLHNPVAHARIAEHVRIAQLIFVQTDRNGMYAGGYNTAANQHWTETTLTKGK